jgi:pyruvate/2-oxoglutarate dehydrogenase complex dihydrolipoamide dehydrogenase (E3) component
VPAKASPIASVRVGELSMSAVPWREATDETQGFMKILVGANDDRILGFTMIGADADELMAVIQTVMLAGLPYPKLRDAVIAHLTTAEGLGGCLRACRLAQADGYRHPNMHPQ